MDGVRAVTDVGDDRVGRFLREVTDDIRDFVDVGLSGGPGDGAARSALATDEQVRELRAAVVRLSRKVQEFDHGIAAGETGGG